MPVVDIVRDGNQERLEFDAQVFNLVARQSYDDLTRNDSAALLQVTEALWYIVLLLALLVVEAGVAFFFTFSVST